MSELTAEESLALGFAEQAGAELERTNEAFAKVKAAMLEQIAASRIGETVLREKVYMGLSVLESVRRVLIADASTEAMTKFIADVREDLGDASAVA